MINYYQSDLSHDIDDYLKLTGVRSDPTMRGVIPNSFDHIFTHISRSQDQQYLVRASYLEIYQVGIISLISHYCTIRLLLQKKDKFSY